MNSGPAVPLDPQAGAEVDIASLRFEVVSGIAAIRALAADWDALFARDGAAPPNLRRQFVISCWELRQDGSTPICIVVHAADKRLIGLLPLAIESSRRGLIPLTTLRPMAQPRVSSFDAILDPHLADSVATLLVSGIESLRSRIDMVDLRFGSADSRIGRAIQKRPSMLKSLPVTDGLVRLPLGRAESWQQLVKGSTRVDIRRLRRRLETDPRIWMGQVAPGAGFVATCEALQRLYSARAAALGWRDWFEPGQLAQGFPAAFEQLAEAGGASLYAITRGKHLIAGHMVLRAHGVVDSLKVAFDPEWAPFGPGAMLHSVVIQNCIERGDRVFDFGFDRDPYKRRWAVEIVPNHRFEWQADSLRMQIADKVSRLASFSRGAWRTENRQGATR